MYVFEEMQAAHGVVLEGCGTVGIWDQLAVLKPQISPGFEG